MGSEILVGINLKENDIKLICGGVGCDCWCMDKQGNKNGNSVWRMNWRQCAIDCQLVGLQFHSCGSGSSGCQCSVM